MSNASDKADAKAEAAEAKAASLAQKVDPEALKLPMAVHYSDKKEWKPGHLVHFAVTGRGLRAIIKPIDSNKFVQVDLEHVEHGTVKPEAPAPV